MTNNYLDLRNATAFLVFSNFAESHPASAQFVWEAVVNNGAKMVVVEPRRTRIAKMAEESGGKFVLVRSGFDTAWINGMIRRVMVRQKAATLYSGHLLQTVSRTFLSDTGATGDLSWPLWTDACFVLNDDTNPTDYARETKTLSGGVTARNMPVINGMDASGGGTPVLEGIGANYTVWDYLWDRVEAYTSDVVAEICGCTEADFEEATDIFIDNSWADTHTTYDQPDYKAGTCMYAMGTTQHSKGTHNTRIYCLLQMLLGNMGKAGGGVNALRGIGNVQGSTDMGMLLGNTIGYNYSQPFAPAVGETMEKAFERYFDGLFGDMYPEMADGNQLPTRFQQRGFHNLMHAWFSDGSGAGTVKAHNLYAFYPKGNGLNHREFFQQTDPSMPGYNAALPDVKAMVCLAMNPGNVEANQLLVREGLKNLDTLVVGELFLTETAEAERKPGSVTYFLPASSFAETSGTIINSGRWIQRRWAARDAVGNTKTDYEIVLRLIKALHDNGAIVGGTAGTDIWPDANYDGAVAGTDNGFTALWGRYFLGNGAENKMHPGDCVDAWNGTGTYTMPAGNFSKYLVNLVADNIYREFGAPLHGVADPRTGVTRDWFGTMWIYSNVGGPALTTGPVLKSTALCAYEPLITPAGYAIGTTIDRLDRGSHLEGFISTDEEAKVAEFDGMLSKSYNPWDSSVTFRGTPGAGLNTHPYWAIAWLFNRRVMYNMGATVTAGDTADLFVAADYVSKFFVHHTSDPIPDTGPAGNPRSGGFMNYSRFYRHTGKFGDPDFRVPRHVEAWETPLTDAQQAAIEAKLGKSIAPIGIAPVGIPGQPGVWANTDALRAQYPLVFTTFRYVMHYQGGSMTRNLGYINATRPRPYLEIHPADAAARGIEQGDEVYLQTMRGKNIGPWVALVGDTIQEGVTGGPWHWGDRGLSTGPSANYACIDALDLSTTMNETKACLCEVTKSTV